MRPTTAAAGAAALLLAAGLAACSGDPEPASPLPTGDPVPSATGTPGGQASTSTAPMTPGAPSPSSEQPVAAPTLPPEATTNDAAGAEAFVAYWYAVSDYAALTGDVTLMREVAAESCETCQRSADFIDERYASGGRFEAVESTVSEVTSPAPGPDGVAIPAYVLDQAASSVIDERGATLNEGAGPPERAYLQMALSWSGEGWVVEEIAS